jgi:four helix bundle protein
MKITRFEDIQTWQEARFLTKMVYDATKGLLFRRDLGLTGQIQRASVSVMANIAEGFDRQTKKEFANFLSYASDSGSELQSHLYVALDQAYVSDEEFRTIYFQAQKTKSLINGFIAYLKGKKVKRVRRCYSIAVRAEQQHVF